MSETVYKLLKEFGYPIALVVIGLMFYAGAIASPVTSTNDLMKAHVVATQDISTELRKLVRLAALACPRQSRSEDCLMALTEKPEKTGTVTVPSVLVVPK